MSFDIHEVRLENFVSFADTTLPLYDQGLVLIKGDNRDEPHKASNGSGKTLIGDAISWLLSSNTSRDILSDDVIGPVKKNCAVHAKIKSDGKPYDVSRYRKNSKFGNGLQVSQGDNISHRRIKDTQDRLEKIIGCSWPLLRLSCFQYGDPILHFSRMRPANRAAVLDEIIGASEAAVPKRYMAVNRRVREVGQFVLNSQHQSATARQRISDWKNSIDQVKAAASEYRQTLINELKSRKERIAELRVNRTKWLKEQIDLQRIGMMTAEREEAALETNRKDLVEARKKRDECMNACARLNAAVISDSAMTPKLANGARCETCGSTMNEENWGKHVAELQAINEKAVPMLAAAQGRLARANAVIERYESVIKELDSATAPTWYADKIHLYEVELRQEELNFKKADELEKDVAIVEDDVKAHLAAQKKTIGEYRVRINGAEKEIQKNFFAIYKWQRELDLLEILSAFYSPAGFRPMVMEHYAPILSDCANYFFKDLTNNQGNIEIISKVTQASGKVIDKVDIQVSEHGVARTFPGAWSMGEGGGVDLCLNSAIMKLASEKAGKQFNFLWLDEVCSKISPEWTVVLIRMLKEKFMRKGMTVLMTSHVEVPEKEFDQIWTVQKSQGVSSVNFG